jgi:hypothetical protein
MYTSTDGIHAVRRFVYKRFPFARYLRPSHRVGAARRSSSPSRFSVSGLLAFDYSILGRGALVRLFDSERRPLAVGENQVGGGIADLSPQRVCHLKSYCCIPRLRGECLF